MFDIDAGRSPALRLIQATDTDTELADIERQMEALSLRHCELMEAKRVAHAQSRPIPASLGSFAEVVPTDWSKPISDEGWKSNDFWDHRHRVMTGSPKITRTTGHIEFLHEDAGT